MFCYKTKRFVISVLVPGRGLTVNNYYNWLMVGIRNLFVAGMCVLISPLTARAMTTSDLVAQARTENHTEAYGDDDGD